MQEAADDLILHSFADGALPMRKDNIDMLKLDCRTGGSYNGSDGSWSGNDKGIRVGVGVNVIERTWTEAYDALAAIAISRYRQALVDERNKRKETSRPDVPAVATLPTVKWTSRAETPPIGEPLLLYEMTNAGPVYTPAMYEGGSTFSKPHKLGLLGRELTGMAHRFSMWLKFPDPSKFGEEYRFGVPAPVLTVDSEPKWRHGKPEEEGYYACWAEWVDPVRGAAKFDPDYEILFWNGSIWTAHAAATKDAGYKVFGWMELPEEIWEESDV